MLAFSDEIHAPIEPTVIYSELEKNFPYYKNLSRPLKERFVERLGFFLREKKFAGRQGLVLTPQIRILVSACAVQVTFGLDAFALDKFKQIVIYPDIYESPQTGKMYKGETNLSGFICLSWKHVWDGIKNPDDNYNLGVHEWMHALRFNGINFRATDYFFDAYINKWVQGAMPEYNKLRAGGTSIFRRYGAANIHEFLSVTTEHFFESPEEFKKEAPEFFDEMCILLNQLPSKSGSVKLGVRTALLNKSIKQLSNTLEQNIRASLWGTISNFGLRFFWVVVPAVMLILTDQLMAYFILFFILVLTLIKMNRMHFSFLFYEDHVRIKNGFLKLLSIEQEISYRKIMDVEVFYASYETANSATVFQFHYFDDYRFVTKTMYCSDPDFYPRNLINLLKKKKVNVLLS